MSKVVIRKVGVVGAGVMGSGIAAHMANAGLEVVMLDMENFAAGGLEKAVKARPAAFYEKSRARLVSTGNIDKDLSKLAGCDLVIEAIIEKLEPKQALFEKLEKLLPAHAIVASNTSGLRIHDMMKGRGDAFKKRFLVMHFFNPVRYMKLLELVAGPDTANETVEAIATFGRDALGKGIVFGKDTPNFVGNRIGTHAMMLGIHEMLTMGLEPEDVDAITGEPMGHPKSASFRTADLVGLDTLVHVADNCFAALTGDEERDVFKVPDFIRAMVDKKLLGNKTKGGFYKKQGTDIQTFDPRKLEYRKKGGDAAIKETCKSIGKIEDVKERVRKLVNDPGKAGQFAWKVISRSLAYAAKRIPEIADDVVAIDDAMKWGYNWELGPFETWDALGVQETIARMKKDGIALPPSIENMKATCFYKNADEVYDLQSGSYKKRAIDPRDATFVILKRGGAAVMKNDGAEAWDLGDGVLGVTFKSPHNSLDEDVIKMLNASIERAERDFRAMVISNTGEHFSVGANVGLIAMTAMQQQFDQIRAIVKTLQETGQRMKYAQVPVVAAPFGMTLGGGLEVCFACDAVQASAETYAGLVEVGVGLIPGGGGNMNMLWRALEGIPDGANVNTYEYVTQVFKNIALARVATSADEAKAFGYFRKTDGVSFDKARLVTEAKARAIGLAEAGYHPPAPRSYVLPGESGIATLSMMVSTLVAGGYATEHDAKIATKLAEVLCGGRGGSGHEVTEAHMLELEREAFVSLCGEPKSLERMQFMLMNNKPLRN
ncbi:MAG TPA: 3-hydroxyacyl-CoA dehydrogenase/enoyl-CoA hydratase family protein [Polyangiaceae bacterium]